MLFAAVERIENEEILVRVVYSASNAEVRKSALLKIRDKSVLKDLGQNDKDDEIRAIAQKLLSQLD